MCACWRLGCAISTTSGDRSRTSTNFSVPTLSFMPLAHFCLSLCFSPGLTQELFFPFRARWLSPMARDPVPRLAAGRPFSPRPRHRPSADLHRTLGPGSRRAHLESTTPARRPRGPRWDLCGRAAPTAARSSVATGLRDDIHGAGAGGDDPEQYSKGSS